MVPALRSFGECSAGTLLWPGRSFQTVVALPPGFLASRCATLRLSSNRLAALPAGIARMHALTSLSVNCNVLTALPDAIGDLPALTFLSVCNNMLTALPDALARLTMPTPSGALVPLSRLARIQFDTGPDMMRSEGGKLVGYVFVDPGDVPGADYVSAARPVVEAEATLPAGVRVEWSGQFKYFERAKAKLALVVPLTLAAVAFLLWLNTGSAVETGIVLLAVPFSLIGAVWLLWGLDYNMSVAVWVGLIALAGLDAETGVVMLLYLTLAHQKHVTAGLMRSARDLEDSIVEGAARRVRPKLMTVLCAMIGLMPVMWSDGTGADVMKRIAAPMVGGLVTSFLLELLVYPAIFAIWKGRGLRKATS
jgi:Cu(I)/Ag(I) efflux system membrane protein CusA/SilA